MGTNYFLRSFPACSHCGRGEQGGLHIGKSSCGWTFGLRIYPNGDNDWQQTELKRLGVEQIASLDDWRPLFERYGVVNEYGDEVAYADIMATITQRSHPIGLLRRHELGGYLKVSFPEGVTYDLVIGEFS